MASEEEKARTAAAAGLADSGAPTIFDKIIAKQIPSDVVYEDEEALAFRDINPQAPKHILVIPKRRQGLTQLCTATLEHRAILGHLMYVASEVARQEGLDKTGYRLVVNDGEAGCQSVYHLHLHVIGGRQMGWPPG
uniref:HIT domain-containing protein n=1 Tax=Pyrodinium bahamense TaxID=73915 RepID=A0A7S0AHD9_9DINO|mmetsp:Transcript_34250/g.94599  ORF Transcript_34250/g.94599 Transcript_34250/m.94599 type:complete len:136 (+) Transcript_34250:77-484(+)